MNNIAKNDELILDIKRMGINGEGIGYHNKLAIFVDNAIMEEKHKVRITEVYKNYAKGESIERIKTSQERVNANCQYYGRCGGCQMMHIQYDKTAEIKRQLVIEAIQRYTDINPFRFEIKPTIKMDNPYNYRNKSTLPVENNGKTNMGIYEVNTNKLVYIENCLVHNEIINQINQEIIKLIDKYNISSYNKHYHGGIISHVVTRVGVNSNEAQVTFILHEKSSKIAELAKEVINIPHVISVYEDYHEAKTHEIFTENLKHLEGKKTIVEKLGKYRFTLLPNAFFQLNTKQTEVLYDQIKKAAKLSNKEIILDAYCGVGTIGMWLSANAKKVIGIESNANAIENARFNAVNNKIKNMEFHLGEVDQILEKLIKDGLKIDVMVFDPPRTGLEERVLETIIKVLPERIVYVSCNPATLAKDLNVLTKQYKIRYIQPLDMFPFSAHIEAICLLYKN